MSLKSIFFSFNICPLCLTIFTQFRLLLFDFELKIQTFHSPRLVAIHGQRTQFSLLFNPQLRGRYGLLDFCFTALFEGHFMPNKAFFTNFWTLKEQLCQIFSRILTIESIVQFGRTFPFYVQAFGGYVVAFCVFFYKCWK